MRSPSPADEEKAELDSHDEDDDAEEEEEDEGENDRAQDKVSEKSKQKRRKRLLQEIAKAKNRGVCYLSRIPPHLKPLKLRHLLSQFGEVLRIYLAPEDAATRLRRKMAGKNSGKNFTEGWVEFSNKKDAKRIAKMLNGEPMGGKKRSAYYYDLWNIKYLRKFKWDNLTEEIAYRNAVREQKQAADISAAKRERDFYLAKVDQSKAISAMEERKTKKQKFDDPPTSLRDNSEPAPSVGTSKIVRHFSQKKSVAVREDGDVPRLSKDVLAAVLGRR
ncbi:hypothetical protein GOP47_0011301 [Adiantum capillus-veneris]|uniref:RRM domain-containing protein n=1 Tax=Adiantum capillus-veneris TaxID=13818 RepID=A0A9D4USJ1_ADICA|nr:hypothetical protein GOP47_0011301 [Adiantum capillus-veneris]